MNSKERVLTAIGHQEPDRAPIDYACNEGIDRRLKAHFGLAADDGEGLLRALHVDFRGVGARYAGPVLHRPIEGRRIDLWGARTRRVAHESGYYWDFCDFPLREATLEQVAAWPMPSPDAFDYSGIKIGRAHV